MKYVCSICGYVYDDAEQQVPFAGLPEDWKCPLCGAAKSDFIAQAPAPVQEEKKESLSLPVQSGEEFQQLSAGQLSALCSNLARGCEKQYKTEEAGLFRELADYFGAITPAIGDATVESVASRLKEEVEGYAGLSEAAAAGGDRGALRVCAWGEKVTRMLSSLVDRYLKQGEEMLKDEQIWLCTVCGFVYIGKEAPQICPVCKVPSWKFEKI